MKNQSYSQLLFIDDVSGALARVFDFFWCLSASAICYQWRFDTWFIPMEYQVVTLLGALFALMSYALFKIYASWRGRRKIHLIGLIFSAHLCAFAVLLGVLVFSHQTIHFSRFWLAGWIGIGLLGVIVFRIFVYELLDRLREKGINQKQLIVIGDDDSTNVLLRSIAEKPWLGLNVVKTYAVLKTAIREQTASREFANLALEVESLGVNEVWISLPLREEWAVKQVLYDLRHSTVNIRYFPSFSDLRLINHKSTVVAGMPAFDLSCSPFDGANQVLKTFEDRLLGMLILLLVSPLLLIIAIGIKLSSPGPVLFKQYRHGMDGQKINVYKFRSMKCHQEAEGVVTQASKQDDRTTAFGRFLRRTSLDELPQFFNVIQGKMSIVGPRPHALAHNEYYKEAIDCYMKRHKVKPGITGWAQVNGLRGETDTVDKMRQRIEYDLFYIENWSLLFDIKIILLTCLKGFVHKNAY